MFQSAFGLLAGGNPSRGHIARAKGSNLWNNGTVITNGESSIVSPGVFRLYSSAGAYTSFNMPAACVIGRRYELTFNVDSVVTPGVLIAVDDSTSGQGFVVSSVGGKQIVFRAATTGTGIKRFNSALDLQISNVQLRQLPGNFIG